MEVARNFFMWCTLINYAVLILWCLLFFGAHDAVKRLNDKFVFLKVEYFDIIHYSGIALYKIAIFLFNLVPWIVLTIIR